MEEKDDIYFDVLNYMCDNFDYSLYATDFNTKLISALKNSLTATSKTSDEISMTVIKVGLQDFFSAIFQKISVYEENEKIKIVKYFDKGAKNESQDKQIHALRQKLVMHKDEVESTLSKDALYIFNESLRSKYETILKTLNIFFLKDTIREQMGRIYSLESKDIIVFLNGKVFLKKFSRKAGSVGDQSQTTIFHDQKFLESLWKAVTEKLNNSFRSSFQFLNYDKIDFHRKYPLKLFSIINAVVKKSFGNISKKDILDYSDIAFKKYLSNLLKEIADYILIEVSKGELEAIKFFKQYLESMRIINEKDNKCDCENILIFLKKRDYLNLKMNYRNKEIKNILEKIKHNLSSAEKSQNEMKHVEKKRSELLLTIKKMENELNLIRSQIRQNSFDINRLESAKRELKEAYAQVEAKFRIRTNILKNIHKELSRLETKRNEKSILHKNSSEEFMIVENKYRQICELLAIALSKR